MDLPCLHVRELITRVSIMQMSTPVKFRIRIIISITDIGFRVIQFEREFYFRDAYNVL